MRGRTEKQVVLKKIQILAISVTWPAFWGAVMSADSLCKTSSANKPKKFTVFYSVPNKDGKRALLAEQLFQQKYHLSLHMCISQYYWTSIFFTANSKIAFKGRIQYFAAKGSHIPNKFSPNLDRVVLPYFRHALSQWKSVIAYLYLKHFTPEHYMTVLQMTLIRHLQQKQSSRRAELGKTQSSELVSPSLSCKDPTSGLQTCFATGCHNHSHGSEKKCKASAGSWTQPLQSYQLCFRNLTLAVLFQSADHTFTLHFPIYNWGATTNLKQTTVRGSKRLKPIPQENAQPTVGGGLHTG